MATVHVSGVQHRGQRLASGRAVQVDALGLGQRRQVGGQGGGDLAAAQGADDLLQVVQVKAVQDIDRWLDRIAEIEHAVFHRLHARQQRFPGRVFLARANFQHRQRLRGRRVKMGPVHEQMGQRGDFGAGQGRRDIAGLVRHGARRARGGKVAQAVLQRQLAVAVRIQCQV